MPCLKSLCRQAEWAEETNDMGVAYQTYLSAGEHLKAIKILGENGWVDKLAEVARGFSAAQVAELRATLPYFEQHGAAQHAPGAGRLFRRASALCSGFRMA